MQSQHTTLRTERLTLRPIAVQDVDALWPHVADPRISRLMSWTAHQDKAETLALVARLEQDCADGRGMTWSIFHDDVFCGIISLINIMRRHRALTYDCAELAYWLGLDWRGQRIMSEAGRAVIEFAFTQLAMHRLEVGHFTLNQESERVIKQWKFTYIGEKRDAFMKDGVWHNAKFYDLLAADLS